MTPPQAWKKATPCDHCGGSFMPAMPWQRFCSTTCKKRNLRQHGRPFSGESERACAECGTGFYPSNPRQVLCSKPCRQASRSRTKAEWQSGLPSGYRKEDHRAARKRQHDRSLDRARNHRKNWTGPELELVARGDLTREELMKVLGRTSYAINSARHLLRVDPRKQALAGQTTTEMEQQS